MGPRFWAALDGAFSHLGCVAEDEPPEDHEGPHRHQGDPHYGRQLQRHPALWPPDPPYSPTSLEGLPASLEGLLVTSAVPGLATGRHGDG